MYRKFFGLNGLPFKTTPDVGVFYRNGSRQEILEALVYTVSRGDGIIKVTGEVGCGKTMLLRLLADTLSDDFSIIYINSPNLSAKDMILYICSELALNVTEDMQKFTLINKLKQELVRLHATGKNVVMLVDEAQSMTLDSLEELRLLSNIETSEDKLLQIVLFGQPELDVALENPQIRQLKSRISYSIHVPPLSVEEVKAYLNYRMRKSAYEGLDVFDSKVSKLIHKLSKGLPRTINIIGDKLLMSVYGSGDIFITKKHINMLPEIEGEQPSVYHLSFWGGVLLILLLLVIGILSYFVFNNTKINQDDSFSERALSGGNSALSVHSESVQALVSSQKNSVNTEDKLGISPKSNPNVSMLDQMQQSADDHPVVAHESFETPPKIESSEPELITLEAYHRQGIRWLEGLENQKYVIQLSTRHIDSFEQTLAFYEQYEIPTDTLHLLIDFNPKIQRFRIKVFYESSNSFSELVALIDKLPAKIRASKPYVTTVKELKKKLELTNAKLNEHGIFNVKS
ncbi:MAG: AAA family ATPase [Gammaproteobacteria bacterium]|nr:AAA family ATPase [Gammaproteobacteria bacterium]